MYQFIIQLSKMKQLLCLIIFNLPCTINLQIINSNVAKTNNLSGNTEILATNTAEKFQTAETLTINQTLVKSSTGLENSTGRNHVIISINSSQMNQDMLDEDNSAQNSSAKPSSSHNKSVVSAPENAAAINDSMIGNFPSTMTHPPLEPTKDTGAGRGIEEQDKFSSNQTSPFNSKTSVF